MDQSRSRSFGRGRACACRARPLPGCPSPTSRGRAPDHQVGGAPRRPAPCRSRWSPPRGRRTSRPTSSSLWSGGSRTRACRSRSSASRTPCVGTSRSRSSSTWPGTTPASSSARPTGFTCRSPRRHAPVRGVRLLPRRGDPPLAMLLRGPDAQVGREALQLEILSADPDAAGELVGEPAPARHRAVPVAGRSSRWHRRTVRVAAHRLPAPAAADRARLCCPRRRSPRSSGRCSTSPTSAAAPRGRPAPQAGPAALRSAGHRQDPHRPVPARPAPGDHAVILSGTAVHLVAAACQLARRHQPSVVVLEDVDLVAGDRATARPGRPTALRGAEPARRTRRRRRRRVRPAPRTGWRCSSGPSRSDRAGSTKRSRSGRPTPAVANAAQAVRRRQRARGPRPRRGRRRDRRRHRDLSAGAGPAAVTTAALARPGRHRSPSGRRTSRPPPGSFEPADPASTRALLGADRGIAAPPGPYAEPGWSSDGPRVHIAARSVPRSLPRGTREPRRTPGGAARAGRRRRRRPRPSLSFTLP